ncbi:hypothetical protein QTP88_019553 [Uroleucon formosanum]
MQQLQLQMLSQQQQQQKVVKQQEQMLQQVKAMQLRQQQPQPQPQQQQLQPQQQHEPPRKQQSHQRQRTPHVQDPQDPTQAGEVMDWEEVTGRRKKIRREKRVSSRPDAIIVKTDNMSSADMLKRFKSSGEMQRVGEAINAITKTKDGHLRILLSRGTNETENLQIAIKNTIGNEVSCTRLSDTSIIEIRDADEEATDDEILEAMHIRAGNNASIRIISKRKLDRGTQIITASILTMLPMPRIRPHKCRLHKRGTPQSLLAVLPKGNKPLDQPSSYRPICLLNTIGKVFERIIKKRLEAHLEVTRGISSHQFGFMKGRSTIDAIKMATNVIQEAGTGPLYKR